MRVVLCDDDGSRVQQWGAALSELAGLRGAEMIPMAVADFARAFGALKDRKVAARDATDTFELPRDDDAQAFDDADILILDYDLTPDTSRMDDGEDDRVVRQQLVGQSGELVAYLARCFSSAGYIVLVNQGYKQSTFDVTLQRFTESMADLNVTAEDLTREALWEGRDGEYRPWGWPRLLDAPSLARECTTMFDLGDRVLATLGLDDDDHFRGFNAKQLDLLGDLGDDPREVTFGDLVGSRLVGLRGRDKNPDAASAMRIAAAGVRRWLERTVLPAQNLIVDAPHLVERQPGLVGAAFDLDSTTDLSAAPAMPEVLDPAVLPVAKWLTRPAWSWPLANRLASQLPPTSGNDVGERVFCEDVSGFHPVDDVRQVRTDVPGPYPQRFIKYVKGVEYHPRSRVLQ